MARLSSIRTNMEMAEKGVWVPYEAGIEIKVTSIDNSKYRACVEALLKPHLRRIRAGLIELEEKSKLIRPAVAKYILVDWKGIEDDEGNNIEYSVAKAEEILGDGAFSNFYDFVLTCSNDHSLFRDQSMEQVEANL